MIDARVARSREGLRSALLRLLDGATLEEITIRDIAAAAGVSYATYFRHYPSKEALLEDVAAEEVARLSELATSVYDIENSYAACLALCTYVDNHRATWTALLTGAEGFVRSDMLRHGRKTAVRYSKGVVPRELSVILSATIIVETLSWWLRQPQPAPPALMAEVMALTIPTPDSKRGIGANASVFEDKQGRP